MHNGCREYVCAFWRISISELRRVAPPVFAVLMVISLLLADGLLPVFASKYRSKSSVYISNNLDHSSNNRVGGGGGGGSISDGAMFSRSSSNNMRYRPKVRVKPIAPRRIDSIAKGGVDSSDSTLLRSHLDLQVYDPNISVSRSESDRRDERGVTDKKSQIIRRENELSDFPEFSSRLDETNAPAGSPSLLSASSSSGSVPPSLLSSSSSLVSASQKLFNSSISEGVGYSSVINSGKILDINTCPDIQHHLMPSAPHEACKTLLSKSQCLVLTAEMAKFVCGKCQTNDRVQIILRSKLRFCSSYDAAHATCASNSKKDSVCPLNESPSMCTDYLQDIVAQDDLVERMYKGFEELISRYDCNSTYSVKWQCHQCKQAYRDWLCSQTIKYFKSDKLVPPCMEFCSHVEEMCPFFRPKLDSYAGDHSFICKDPHMNLPSTISEDNCYSLCHLWDKSLVTDFYCSHANVRGANCHLHQRCNELTQQETIKNLSTNSTINNSTSGSNTMYTVARTPKVSFCILLTFCTVLASILRLPLTMFEAQNIPEGLT